MPVSRRNLHARHTTVPSETGRQNQLRWTTPSIYSAVLTEPQEKPFRNQLDNGLLRVEDDSRTGSLRTCWRVRLYTSEHLRMNDVYTREDLRRKFGITDATIKNGIFRPKGHASVWLFVTEEKTPNVRRCDGSELGPIAANRIPPMPQKRSMNFSFFNSVSKGRGGRKIPRREQDKRCYSWLLLRMAVEIKGRTASHCFVNSVAFIHV